MIQKFHLIFNRLDCIAFMIQDTFEKEVYLKDLVVKLLKDRNLSDFDMLDSLFEEIKRELQNQPKPKD